jgi:hypothetical protein
VGAVYYVNKLSMLQQQKLLKNYQSVEGFNLFEIQARKGYLLFFYRNEL